MEVSYTTTVDDYVAYNMHAIKRSPSLKRRLVLGWLFVPLWCWIGAALLFDGNPTPAAVLAAAGVVYAVIHPFVQRASITSAFRAYAQDLGVQGVIGRIHLTLENDTFTERTELVQSVARWRDMRGVEVVGDCTYIYVTGLLAAIVPRRGFENPEDYDAVRDFAVAKLGKHAKPDRVPEA